MWAHGATRSYGFPGRTALIAGIKKCNVNKKQKKIHSSHRLLINLLGLAAALTSQILSDCICLSVPPCLPPSCARICGVEQSYFPSHWATAFSCAWIICRAVDQLPPCVQLCNCDLLLCGCCRCIKRRQIRWSL